MQKRRTPIAILVAIAGATSCARHEASVASSARSPDNATAPNTNNAASPTTATATKQRATVKPTAPTIEPPADAPNAKPTPGAPAAATASSSRQAETAVEDPDLVRAVRDCVTQDPTVTIKVKVHEGDFARVLVVPANIYAYESLTVFLKREHGEWTCVDKGTWFSCEELEKAGFPASVRAICD